MYKELPPHSIFLRVCSGLMFILYRWSLFWRLLPGNMRAGCPHHVACTTLGGLNFPSFSTEFSGLFLFYTVA